MYIRALLLDGYLVFVSTLVHLKQSIFSRDSSQEVKPSHAVVKLCVVSRRSLSWEKRIKIASGAARGLKYLHENNIIHRDMRPNNILVTHDHESLVGDFGLARAHEGNLDHSSETRVVGTLGYLAPEYAESGKLSTKTDVYAFGVVLLQLITGYTTNDKKLKGRSLVGWVRKT
uniref:non-specific serine/threonine protein kinase n=1 Tax=Kalanchoe fedtschenkoi TaxID=63787 RepID=A0A7N0V9X9_KALFE